MVSYRCYRGKFRCRGIAKLKWGANGKIPLTVDINDRTNVPQNRLLYGRIALGEEQEANESRQFVVRLLSTLHYLNLNTKSEK